MIALWNDDVTFGLKMLLSERNERSADVHRDKNVSTFERAQWTQTVH